MSVKALPIIFFNLSGEMIYVIQQRLEAQNISDDKAKKVMQDIVSTMLNDQFIEELFKPQNMYSRSAMQSVFEKLVHSSIMRLNSNSMAKLYDLMLMVFKYQVMNCEDPENILPITLNHMDAIKNCTIPYPELKKRIQDVYSLLILNYKDFSHEEFESLYDCIFAFLQDLNIRVSVLIKLGLQSQNGEIILLEKKMSCDEPMNTSMALASKQMLLSNSSLDFDGDRGTSLGTNIYLQSILLQSPPESKTQPAWIESTSNENRNDHALEEITLLSRLIGKCNQSDFIPENLFASNCDLKESNLCASIKSSCSLINIDATQVCQKELGKISNDLYIKDNKEEKCDILELLDIADNI